MEELPAIRSRMKKAPTCGAFCRFILGGDAFGYCQTPDQNGLSGPGLTLAGFIVPRKP